MKSRRTYRVFDCRGGHLRTQKTSNSWRRLNQCHSEPGYATACDNKKAQLTLR